jgi:hypothetical protein
MAKFLVLYSNTAFGVEPPTSPVATAPDIEFTRDRRRVKEADAVVFHLPGPYLFRDAPKYPGQLWVSWTMESHANTHAWRRDHKAVPHFDLHMGFPQSADIWHTYLPSLAEWQTALTQNRQQPTEPVPAVLFQSAGSDKCGRDDYLTELMAELKFDSYGRFLNNRSVPQPDRGPESKLDVIRSYRFTLGFENTIEEDYVTEKFYQPLLIGSVPVYRGAPNVAEYAPGEHCYIDASKYTPRELAAYLRELSENEVEYARYHVWRSQPLRPAFLELLKRHEAPFHQRLAETLQERLRARGPRPAGKPIYPFGIRGYLDGKYAPVHRALRKARKSLKQRLRA